ncbi:MAG: class I SAM-dependent methyltransferase [Chloroflexi bacterium]|nr:class I SAM-dependent methyltransferase [Chloroflexota bacterium]MDA1147403.1 class I SAM-dependent methyltransferase [Chloroflexota bacterium]
MRSATEVDRTGAGVAESDYLQVNREHWQGNAPDYVEAAERNWAGAPRWGIWGIPESEAGILPLDLEGKVTVELGCGTGYVSAWVARRGARPIALDLTPEQLATARRMQRQHGLEFTLIRGVGEHVPLPDGCADLVISEYGSAIWSDPYEWIPEAARLLKPGGELVFLGGSVLLMLMAPEFDGVAAETTLLRPQRGLHRLDWPADPDSGVEFYLSHGDWIGLFRANELEVEELIELYPSEDATTRYPFVTLEWARQWPAEEVWRVRKR